MKKLFFSYLLIVVTYLLGLWVAEYFVSFDSESSLKLVVSCFFVVSLLIVTVDFLFGGKEEVKVGLGSTVGGFFIRLLLIAGFVIYLRKVDIEWDRTELLYVVVMIVLFMSIEKFIILNEKVFGRN